MTRQLVSYAGADELQELDDENVRIEIWCVAQ